MASATKELEKAAVLTQLAEEIEASVIAKEQKFAADAEKAEAKFREGAARLKAKFDESMAGERAKVKEVKREAAAAIRKASAAMGDGPASTGGRRPSGRSRGAADPAEVVAFVKANDGTNAVAVASHLGVSVGAARKAVDALVAEGALTKTGQRRGTKLHAT